MNAPLSNEGYHTTRDVDAITASAPTRLDFGGGWTDVPPYPERRGGFVCNIAINRYATVRVARTGAMQSSMEEADSRQAPPAIVTAALRMYQAEGLAVSLHSDFPTGAGLGGSSAACVAIIAALKATEGRYPDDSETRTLIAEESRALEVNELGIAGGRQDHYAAAYGGALGISFGESTSPVPIPLRGEVAAELERRCILAFTGESRISGNTINAVIDAFIAGEEQVTGALDSMKRIAIDMRDALAAGDIDALGLLLGEQWTHQRSLHPLITTRTIDTLDRATRSAGALGLKALGASGGGCVIAIAKRGKEESVRNAAAEYAQILDWRIAHRGVTVHTS